eukprot:TRINITY_DN3354_c0_g2_i11.p1 TRINITY_DN3354_c0_g2~~TRINITY_DN3354_c0_g2_i11.p1  ORF type:complete len:470 (+),score=30.64 TRINITY_DN3354_c0_g2_i11:532-1941(+)
MPANFGPPTVPTSLPPPTQPVENEVQEHSPQDSLCVGRTFPSYESLHASVVTNCAIGSKKLRTRNQVDRRVTFSCVTESSCPVRVCAIATGGDQYRVTACHLTHSNNCTEGKTTYGIKNAVVHLIMEKVRALGTKYTTRHVLVDMHDRGITISEDVAWSALRKAISEVDGDPSECYMYLQSWCEAITQTNPGTKWCIQEDENGRFRRMFLALGGSLQAMQYCPKGFFVTDGCSLRGYYTGNIISLITIDGYGRQLPVAFGIIGNENSDAWEWFLTQARVAIGDAHFNRCSIMSDRQKGLAAAIPAAMPQANSLICSFHLKNNVKEKMKSKTAGRDLELVQASPTKEGFDALYQALPENLREYLDGIEKSSWATSHISTRTYGHSTSNLAESFNATLGETRHRSILGILNSLVQKLQKWHHRRAEENDGSEEFVPRVQTAVGTANQESAKYTALGIGTVDEVFEGMSIPS